MRKMSFVQDLPRYTVTYCQYGDIRQKPTDIWTNHPNPKFKPACKPKSPCHEPAPRGSRTGTQGIKDPVDRSRIPQALCEHIVEISKEEYRYCSECGYWIQEGYCINDGDEYYCSDECLHKHYSQEQYEEMYTKDEAYWTQWS